MEKYILCVTKAFGLGSRDPCEPSALGFVSALPPQNFDFAQDDIEPRIYETPYKCLGKFLQIHGDRFVRNLTYLLPPLCKGRWHFRKKMTEGL